MGRPTTGAPVTDLIRWVAQTVHNAYHADHDGAWWGCPKSTCRAAADALPEYAKQLGGEVNPPKGKAPPDPVDVGRLAEIRVARYAEQVHRAAVGDLGVRMNESLELLQLWLDIQAKHCAWANLNSAERDEILDAIDAEG